MTDKERLQDIKNRFMKHEYDYALSGDDVVWLINRVEELEETNKKNYWIAADFKFENLKLEQQNKRYREALEFYADEESYEPLEVQIGAVTKEGYKISKYKYDPKINTDKGEKARQALGWE